jgi:hypothetical protein
VVDRDSAPLITALRHHRSEPKLIWAPREELQEVIQAERLAYSRKQAAETLGVSISTIDRRVVPSVHTVKTPWDQRLIPVAELERFLREHLEPPREPGESGTAGRPASLPRRVVERIRLEVRAGPQPRRHRPVPQRGRHPDRARRAAVLAFDGARRSRPLESGTFRRRRRTSCLAFAEGPSELSKRALSAGLASAMPSTPAEHVTTYRFGSDPDQRIGEAATCSRGSCALAGPLGGMFWLTRKKFVGS